MCFKETQEPFLLFGNTYIKHGSVRVSEAGVLQEREWIGLVGNSGNTTEPHLHIHAEKDGAGIPIQFNGESLTRNNLLCHNPEVTCCNLFDASIVS